MVTVQTVWEVPLHILNECGEVLIKDEPISTINPTSMSLLGGTLTDLTLYLTD